MSRATKKYKWVIQLKSKVTAMRHLKVDPVFKIELFRAVWIYLMTNAIYS